MMRHPLLPIAAAFAAGIGTAPHFYLTANEQILFLSLCVFGAALLLRAGRCASGLIFCWLGFFLCGAFLAAEEHTFLPQNHLELLARRGLLRPDQPSQIIGWARTPSIERPGGETLDLEVTEVRQEGRSLPARGVIRLYHFVSRQQPELLNIAYGARLAVSVRNLRRPRNFLTPGSFDWEAHMHRQGISFMGLLRTAGDVKELPGRSGNFWRSAIYGLRERFLAYLDASFPSHGSSTDQKAILKAMLLANDNWLSPRTESAFQKSGTYHVLVISGYNVVVLTVVLFLLSRLVRLPSGVATPLVAVAVLAFAFLAEATIPVFRAALMALVYLAARVFYRERALLNSIAAAALILLLLNPSDLWDAGFQLSFLAVLVLAAIALPMVQWKTSPYRVALRGLDELDRDRHFQPQQAQFRSDVRVLLDFLCAPTRLSRRPWRWFRASLGNGAFFLLWVAEAALFTFVVQLGFALVTAVYFHRITWSGIFANLLILPLVGVLTPLGMAVLGVSLLWWPLADFGGIWLGWCASGLRAIAEWSAGFEGLNGRVPSPPLWLSLSFLALLIAVAVLVARRSRWVWAPASALLCLCVILTVAPYPAQIPRGRLEVTTLDVGHGDSLFITFPQGTTMLIDGGGVIPFRGSSPPRQDVGESVLSSYLWSRRIQSLDIVVLTHAHWDHYGGLEALFENFRVGEFWMGPDPADRMSNLNWLRNLAVRAGARIVRPHRGTTRRIDGVEVLVLSPPADWSPRRVSNNDSILLRLGYGSRHILLPGDVESRMERRLLEDGLPLGSDVLKVAHHGSETSTTEAFLERVAPRFGIISVGAYSRFGHPDAEVLEALRHAKIRTYRTDQDGAVTVSTDGNRIELNAFRDTLRPWPRFAP